MASNRPVGTVPTGSGNGSGSGVRRRLLICGLLRLLVPLLREGVASLGDGLLLGDHAGQLVRDGDTVVIEGFTHLICFAAGHEIIRQRKRDLTLARMTPDLIYDQMIAGGVARKLIFSWLGNPGVGSLHAVRRRVENADPEPLMVAVIPGPGQ
mgnify:CR=1 FL=1